METLDGPAYLARTGTPDLGRRSPFGPRPPGSPSPTKQTLSSARKAVPRYEDDLFAPGFGSGSSSPASAASGLSTSNKRAHEEDVDDVPAHSKKAALSASGPRLPLGAVVLPDRKRTTSAQRARRRQARRSVSDPTGRFGDVRAASPPGLPDTVLEDATFQVGSSTCL